MKELDFLHVLKADPVPYLLEKAPPHIRYHVLTKLFGWSDEDGELDELLRECWGVPEFRRIISGLNDDGLWEPKEQFSSEQRQFGIQFLTQVQRLHELLDLGGSREVDEIQQGIVALMKMQHSDGKFPLFFQHQGYALWVLMKYGMQGNPFVDRGLRWLLRRQREDSGWLHTVQIPSGEDKEEYPSCIWTTCHALWPLVYHNVYVKDNRTIAGVRFLLEHFLQKNHTNFFNSPDAWDYLYIGHDDNGPFRGGTLKMLEIAVEAGFDISNKVVKKASHWIRDQQLGNGLFPAVAGRDEEGDFMVTVRALNMLRKLHPEVELSSSY